MIITLLAHHIQWDTDGDDTVAQSLPTKLEITIDLSEMGDWHDTNQRICNQLSDETGWCVLDYRLQGYDSDADYALQMTNFFEQTLNKKQ